MHPFAPLSYYISDSRGGFSSRFATLDTGSMFALSKQLFVHVFPRVVRPLHILWNQIIGFFFLVLAAGPIPSAIRSYRDPNGMPRLVMSMVFILIMAGFAISSFLRARKISRS